jgi:hypothetical protein
MQKIFPRFERELFVVVGNLGKNGFIVMPGPDVASADRTTAIEDCLYMF